MDTKKTIFVSIVTTLATMFVVAVCIHLCTSHCGQSRCGHNAMMNCSSYGHGSGNGMGRCAEFSGHGMKCEKIIKKCCKGDAKCKAGSKCKDGKKCKNASKCSKDKNIEVKIIETDDKK